MGGHKAVSHLVRINLGLGFIVRLEAADEGIKGFEVIFGDIEFNVGVSKVSMEAREESIARQMGSVKSTICWNINSILRKSCLKRVKREASGTLEKPQKPFNSLQRERRRMSREAVGMEKSYEG